MILSGKKFKLRGVGVLGRPGVALCIGSRKNVQKFANKLKGAMPQKKFGIVDIPTSDLEINGEEDDDTSAAARVLDEFEVDGFESASLAELRELLTAMGREDRFLALMGMDAGSQQATTGNSNATPKENDTSNNNNAKNKSAGRKKRKKR